VFERVPQLEDLKQALVECGAEWAAMSGSGSTIVGAFRDERARDAAAASCEGRVRAVRAVSGLPEP
jgi:4-diphosphocytidyl-2-C-methyl-D-erythritol kinase